MRIKLYEHGFLETFLHDWITGIQVNIWNLNFFVYKQSKSKEQIQDILKYDVGGFNPSIGFKRKPINSKKYGPDQQAIYSPFSEHYNVEMEDKELVRLVFMVPRK